MAITTETKNYSVEPEYKKSVIQIETFYKDIHGKGIANYKIYTYFRECSFIVSLTDEQVNEIKEKCEFSSMSYDCEIEYVSDIWDVQYEMVKRENFTIKDLSDIEKKLLEVFTHDDDHEYEDEYDIYEKLEEDGWDIEDTEYIMKGNIIFTEM